MVSKILLFLFLVTVFLCTKVKAYFDINVPNEIHAIDQALFEHVLDPELCEEQMDYILANHSMLRNRFLDAGIRTPRGIITGNLVDLGNYYQCLGIIEEIPNSVVHGKYCMITVPLDQELQLPSLPEWPEFPEFPWPELNPETTRLSSETIRKLEEYNAMRSGAQILLGSMDDDSSSDSSSTGLSFQLAVCVPKTCTTKQTLEKLFYNMTSLGLEYQDNFCRLPNDKQWVAADYVAAAVFSFIGLLTLLSTSYDLHHTVFLGNDPKKANKLYQSFSVYTNTRRLVSYTAIPGALECLDGVRSFAMMWVIIGHTFVTQLTGFMANPLETFEWITSYSSLWITTAPITVDTFFMLSGLLLVYTSAGKLTRIKLFKNLHLFYLNRLLRMFPVLAATVLLQASLFNRVTDGPNWSRVALDTNRCRVYWWTTLLYIQNYVNPEHMCLPHTWYLAIDIQLHILSPLVLFWVLGKKRVAWVALISVMLVSLTVASVYNFIMEFPSGPVVPSRIDEQAYYLTRYYINTLTRASPFFVGMIYGYLLHLYRGKQVIITKLSATILWLCAIALGCAVLYSTYPIVQFDWNNQTVDSIINSYMRPAWALVIGWLIFACVHGYGGPVNWILSLHMWKILGRLSYAMYIVHYPLIYVVNSTALAPTFFSVHFSLFKFLADFLLAVIVAFIMTVLVDSPCSVLIKHFLGGGPRRPQPPAITDDEKTKKEVLPAMITDYVRPLEAKTRM